MVPEPISRLLILQDKDQRRLSLEAQLKAVPVDVAAVDAKISAEKAAIDSARTELRELEAKKKVIETEIGSAENQLARYKSQQLAVRKNDEYQALGHEIESTQAKIGGLEGQELEVMYAIDGARVRFAEAERILKANISGHEARKAVLSERDASLRAEHTRVAAEVEEARRGVEAPGLRLYDRIAARHMPVCVPLRGGKCGGCHLKVSAEVESASRGKGPSPYPTCDTCGRILWWDGA
jgi:uncharacterized protein